MPHSPFTRFLGLAIVAAYAVALLWPDPGVLIMGWRAMIALPVVILLFTWSAVRDVPVFDDRAFHRTLPPGDGHAFRRTLMIHGMVLAGIAMSVMVYCWIFNFGWQAMSFGVAALTVPVWGFMAASGIATSLSTSRQYGKSWGYIAIFVMPVFSATLLLSVHSYFPPEVYRWPYYFTSLREMAVAGATLYPLIWWLVAVKRRRVLGAVLGMATGALMPWIYIYGSFFEKPEEAGPEIYQKSQVTLSRKPFVPDAGKWLAVEDLLHIDGLRAGEYIEWAVWVGGHYLQAYQVPNDPAQADASVSVANLLGADSGDGSVNWGRTAVWDCLRQQIPPHETFGFWNRKLDIPTHLAVLRPGESAMVEPLEGDYYFKSGVKKQPMTDQDFSTGSFRIGSLVFRTEKMGEVSAEGGGTFRLPEGGILRVNPLHRDDVHYSISFQRYSQDLWQADGPWFKPRDDDQYWGQVPWVIAVDESGKHAFALTPRQMVSSEKVMLGTSYEWTVNLGDAKTPEEIARMEMLRRCSLHVFWPKLVSALRQEIPLAK